MGVFCVPNYQAAGFWFVFLVCFVVWGLFGFGCAARF
jgi:hypothetical protein